MTSSVCHLAVCQNLVPLVNIKIAGKWMFIPLKMVLIGIDPYPYCGTVEKSGHAHYAHHPVGSSGMVLAWLPGRWRKMAGNRCQRSKLGVLGCLGCLGLGLVDDHG